MSGRRLLDASETHPDFPGPDCARRRAVLRETLAAFAHASPPDRFHRLAQDNLARWRAGAPDRRDGKAVPVAVMSSDWGVATLALTKAHGECFAVLDMANAYAPGGAYVEGAVAQEENIFRRTDCHFHIGPDTYDAAKDRYLPAMTRLFEGRDGRVFLDSERPRVCIRGPEDRTAPDLGYPWLGDDEVFPFFEVRAAAQDLRGGDDFDDDDARRRIAAQLDTLREHGVRHAVLGASGCGAFENPPERVAQLYREELAARRGDFSAIAFAIYRAGYGPDNHAIFSRVFAE